MGRLKLDGLKQVRFSFADQHGVLRGKTLAVAEVPAALERGVTVTSTLILKDTSHRTVFPAFTAGGGIDMDMPGVVVTESRRSYLRGRIGDGNGTLRVSTGSGGVSFRSL